MSPEELFAAALGLQTPWFIEQIEFEHNEKHPLDSKLHLHLMYDPGHTFKSETGKRCPVYDHVDRKWRHLNFFQHECHLYAKVPRIETPDGNIQTIEVPWARPGSSFTLMMEAYCMAIAACGMSLPKAGKMVGLDSRVIGRMIDHAVEEGLKKTPLGQVNQLSNDETSSKKGHNYVTILSDAQEKKVVGIGVGKNKEAVKAGIQEMESWALRLQKLKKWQLIYPLRIQVPPLSISLMPVWFMIDFMCNSCFQKRLIPSEKSIVALCTTILLVR